MGGKHSLPALPQGYGKSAPLWHDLVHEDLHGLGILLNIMHIQGRLIDDIMAIRQVNLQVAELLGALETCALEAERHSLWDCRDL